MTEECNCANSAKSLDAESDLKSQIIWLDERNTARAEWLAGIIRGSLKADALDGKPLANNLAELKIMSAGSLPKNVADYSIIRTVDQLRDWAAQAGIREKNPLGRLSEDEIETFISEHVIFADYVEEGTRYRHLSSFYFGDLKDKNGFSYADLFEVAGLFGMSPDFFVKANNKFGCDIHPRSNCQPKYAYSCPFSGWC